VVYDEEEGPLTSVVRGGPLYFNSSNNFQEVANVEGVSLSVIFIQIIFIRIFFLVLIG
jgi:hypothetical protein